MTLAKSHTPAAMLFTTPVFAVFFLIVFCLYYLPMMRRWQVGLLVAASFFFYAWNAPWLLLLLICSIAINSATSYVVARCSARARPVWAALGVIANIGILCLFKYGALLTGLAVKMATAGHSPEEGLVSLLLNLPLPIGISFYTFEGVSLLVDVLRHRSSDEPGAARRVEYVNESFAQHALNTSLFVAFFPHLVAGPILKARQFYPQIAPKRFRDIPWEFVFRTLVTGFFLKMVVADNLKDYTYYIAYPYYEGFGTVTCLVLLFGYSIQIFADFAGYSLIAIGLAAALGYTLPPNFNFPYISRSLSEFWRRWHISLSTWLRDYLYIPLGGNRLGKRRTYLNLMIVMGLGGLWHGAAWSYAVWGLYHGAGLALERLLGLAGSSSQDNRPSGSGLLNLIRDLARALVVFTFVTFGWLLFKLPEFGQAMDYLATMAHNWRVAPSINQVVPVVLFSLPVVVYHALHFPLWRPDEAAQISRGRRLAFDGAVGIMLAMIVLNSGTSKAFIYFQF